MRQISDTLNDIDILDTACHTASSRLSSIRHSKVITMIASSHNHLLKIVLFSIDEHAS